MAGDGGVMDLTKSEILINQSETPNRTKEACGVGQYDSMTVWQYGRRAVCGMVK